MKAKERMIKALTDLLKPGETLMYPVCGILHQGEAEYYCYFGLTLDAYDFPMYGLGAIKRYCPGAEIRFEKGVAREILFFPAISVFLPGCIFLLSFNRCSK